MSRRTRLTFFCVCSLQTAQRGETVRLWHLWSGVRSVQHVDLSQATTHRRETVPVWSVRHVVLRVFFSHRSRTETHRWDCFLTFIHPWDWTSDSHSRTVVWFPSELFGQIETFSSQNLSAFGSKQLFCHTPECICVCGCVCISGETPYKCSQSQCDASFVTSSELKKHMRRLHPGEISWSHVRHFSEEFGLEHNIELKRYSQ